MICSIRCPICGNYMGRGLSKNGKPYLFCSVCGYGMLVMRRETVRQLDTTCRDISENELPGPTREKQRGRT